VAGANAWNAIQASAANWVTGTQVLQFMTKYTQHLHRLHLRQRRLKGLRLGAGLQYRGRG